MGCPSNPKDHGQKAIFDVRLDDVDGDGDLDLWLLGTDLGIASLSKTLLTQEGRQPYRYIKFRLAFEVLSMAWNVSIPIGQDDAFDYQPIPDLNGDSLVDLAVLLAEEAHYSSTLDSWRPIREKVLESRGNCQKQSFKSE